MLSNIDHVLAQLEGMNEVGPDQWISRCPAHHDKSPSLSISIGGEGQVLLYCFAGCDLDDIVASLGMDVAGLWPDRGKDTSPEELRLRKLEAGQKKMQRELREHGERLAAIERIHRCTDHVGYYHNLLNHPEAVEYWMMQGMKQHTIDRYQLGYCDECRTDYPDLRPSYTIPVVSNGHLWNIRHRLVGAVGSKYRPHMKGLPNVLFNADDLRSGENSIMIVEGEKKSLSATQQGWTNVGIMGKQGFKPEWASKFKQFKRVVVALDPDAEDRAIEIAGLFKGRGYVAELPEKLDDMLNPYGDIQAKPTDIRWLLNRARKVI